MTGKFLRIKACFEGVQAKIDAAALRAGREPKSVQLIAVTKLMPLKVVQSAYAAGDEMFWGELSGTGR